MAKYLKKQNKHLRPWQIGLLILLAVLLVVFIYVAIRLSDLYEESKIPILSATTPTTQPAEGTTEPPLQPQPEFQPILLGDGLQITRIDSYSGMYVEDGSDEIVSGILMIIVENTAQRDLQLARISLTYEGVTAQFQVSNLPAGAKAVLLESSRANAMEEMPISAEARNVAFFEEPMTLLDGVLEITGGDNYLEVTNISGEDLSGNLDIYYKNYVGDLYYGGITYHAGYSGGIKSGETVRIVTVHYAPENSVIVRVTSNG